MQQFNNETIIVRAPGKLTIMGEHAVLYGYPCLVTAVNQYITVKADISNNITDKISISSSDDRFVKAALSVFRSKYSINNKVILTTESGIGRYGLGSSAAVTVATIKALSELFGRPMNNQNLFNLSYRAVLKIQKLASGFDIAASIYGGTILFDGKNKHFEKLTEEPIPLLVAFSAVKADTVTMINQVATFRSKKSSKVDHIFRSIAKLVLRAKKAIQNKNWVLLGELFKENQRFLAELEVSTPKIDKMIKDAVDAGAYGAKISGAGGGDCIIALVSDEKRRAVEKALSDAGGIVLDVQTGAEGVHIEN